MAAPTNRIAPGNSKWSLYLPDSTSNPTVDASTDVQATGVFSAAQLAWMNQSKQLSVGVFLEWSALTVGAPIAIAQFEYTLTGSTLWNQLIGCSGQLVGANGVAGVLGFEFDWNSVPSDVEQFRINWLQSTLSGAAYFILASARTFAVLQRKK